MKNIGQCLCKKFHSRFVVDLAWEYTSWASFCVGFGELGCILYNKENSIMFECSLYELYGIGVVNVFRTVVWFVVGRGHNWCRDASPR